MSQAAASWGARLGVLAVPTLRSIGGRVASTHGFQELDNFLLEVEVREHLWRTHQKVLAEVGGSTHWLALRSGLGEDDMDDFDQDQPEEEWTDFDDDDDEEEEYDSDDDDEDKDDDGGWAEPEALFASVLSPTVDAKALAAARAALSAIQGKRAVHLLLSADRLGSDPLTGAPEVTYKTQEAGARGWVSTAVLAGGARVRGDVCTKKKDAENGAALAAAAALIAHYTSTEPHIAAPAAAPAGAPRGGDGGGHTTLVLLDRDSASGFEASYISALRARSGADRPSSTVRLVGEGCGACATALPLLSTASAILLLRCDESSEPIASLSSPAAVAALKQ